MTTQKKIEDRPKEHGMAFREDMGPRPGPGYSLDRIDVNKDYTPDNCRWASNTQQQRNKRDNRVIKAFGEAKPVAEWADDPRCKTNLCSLYWRVRKGWEFEKAIITPSRKMEDWRHART